MDETLPGSSLRGRTLPQFSPVRHSHFSAASVVFEGPSNDPQGLAGWHVIHGPVLGFGTGDGPDTMQRWVIDHPLLPQLNGELVAAFDRPALNGVKLLLGGDVAEIRVNGQADARGSAALRSLPWPRSIHPHLHDAFCSPCTLSESPSKTGVGRHPERLALGRWPRRVLLTSPQAHGLSEASTSAGYQPPGRVPVPGFGATPMPGPWITSASGQSSWSLRYQAGASSIGPSQP